tara:strand:+ start:28 stop:1350 length:1323 start_codon:yes stop_codon:yes gene_type:complete
MANTYLYRDATGSTHVTKATISCWFKKATNGTEQHIWFSGLTADYGQYSFRINFNTDDTLRCMNDDEGTNFKYETNRKFRDTFGYYHICLTLDQTNGTAADRAKLWINGVRETSFSTQTNMSGSRFLTGINGYRQVIGRHEGGTDAYLDGVLSHYYYIDGTAYDADVFGEEDASTGEWKIKTSPSVTMGTNGFTVLKDGNTYTDQSSNSNDLTLGGGTLTKTEDNPSNVFACGNALEKNSGRLPTLSNGNTTYTAGTTWSPATSTLGMTKGKFYMEMKPVSGAEWFSGVVDQYGISTNALQYAGYDALSVGYYKSGGKQISASETGYGNSYTTGDVIGCAIDIDNGKVYFSKNGTWQNSGDPTSGSTGTGAIDLPTSSNSTGVWFFAPSVYNGALDSNYGNGYFGTTAISSEGTNASGIGKFEYDVPTGYTALSTKGLNE